jgi:hypothetical protein
MILLYHIRGSHFVDTPISMNSDGLIEINFTEGNIPRANHLKPWVLPKYCLVTKPMDLAIGICYDHKQMSSFFSFEGTTLCTWPVIHGAVLYKECVEVYDSLLP